MRFLPPTPSARSLPDWICGVVCTSEENITWLWPAITSIMAGPPPLNAHVKEFHARPAARTASRRDAGSCRAPAEAQPNFPGVSFASAISSFTFLAGRPGLTTSTFGPAASIAIGVKDLIGS